MEYNVVLLVIVVLLTLLVFAINIYILIRYQHPDDSNQAYLPKIIVVIGLSIAQLSILMLPADVANRHSCEKNLYVGACKLTLPMKQLWWAVYIIDTVLVYLVIPFAIFFYESDQEKTVTQRIKNALLWVVILLTVFCLLLGILYAVIGYADFTVRRLSSTTLAFTNDFSSLNAKAPCLFPAGFSLSSNVTLMCAAYTSGSLVKTTWSVRAPFPTYVIALNTIIGSILFTMFGGVGMATLPVSLIFAFKNRPKCVITRVQYVKEATDLAKRSNELKKVTLGLQREERGGKKGRKLRKNVKKVQQELVFLEDDVQALNEAFPQGEKADTSWALTVLFYLAKLVFGILGLALSIIWLLHIIVFMLVNPPAFPFLNQVFIQLDSAWGLLGTTAFAIFCYYLVMSVISGEMHLGMRLLFLSIHPMKYQGTLMNSFLFNVAIILLCSTSVIQFCTKAFSLYAEATAAQEIFGHSLESLRGLKYLFIFNVFQIAFIVFAFLSFLCYWTCGQKRQRKTKFTIERDKKEKEKRDKKKKKKKEEV
ncbi:LIMR family protein SELMODRAFT_432208-like [Selaginella moellendorffii]|uniref:LIMR family protein SELMODRAFT_432208-like n=1 Tax=Selaginella moellendorffii TaxID=88036 RepID=UPI000D1C3615|nr:LIMR family protein SELMODRAFT_432208-like [Selaginella moellendorffii]|eukprot:XP_024537196.1 LIMR family protein SELMODRAFT_432208-like [Selaginella moellendorffii]